MAKTTSEHPVNGVKKPFAKKQKPVHVEKDFRVISEGYQEDFDTKAAAMEQVAIMKKRAIKSKEPIKVSVKELENGRPGKEVHKLSINEDYYQD